MDRPLFLKQAASVALLYNKVFFPDSRPYLACPLSWDSFKSEHPSSPDKILLAMKCRMDRPIFLKQTASVVLGNNKVKLLIPWLYWACPISWGSIIWFDTLPLDECPAMTVDWTDRPTFFLQTASVVLGNDKVKLLIPWLYLACPIPWGGIIWFDTPSPDECPAKTVDWMDRPTLFL